MPRTQNLASRYLVEVINYGGFPVMRVTAYELACRACGTTRGASWFAFGPNTRLLPGMEPMTREAVEAEMEKIEKDA